MDDMRGKRPDGVTWKLGGDDVWGQRKLTVLVDAEHTYCRRHAATADTWISNEMVDGGSAFRGAVDGIADELRVLVHNCPERR